MFVFEPHVQFTQAKNFCGKVRYYVVAVAEASGHSGGVWAPSREDSPYFFDTFNSMPQCVSVKCLVEERSGYVRECMPALPIPCVVTCGTS